MSGLCSVELLVRLQVDANVERLRSRLDQVVQLQSWVGKAVNGRASIAESYAGEDNGRLMLFNANLPSYEAARVNHEPRRPRELLVKIRERNRLLGLIRREGMTLVPLTLYFNDRGIAKIQIGLAKGRKKQDKRNAARERDWGRHKARLLSNRSL